MEAFHAPPEAVIAPVMKYGKMPGIITLRHHNQPRTRKFATASFISPGNAAAPAMTLNRIYHCVPISISGVSQMFGLT